MSAHILEGDVVEVLSAYADNSFDAVLCDPPYGLSFMGRKWDYDVPQAALWREVLRVCKPGAALIAFSGTRTYHRAVVQIEDAGWEIRDQFAWMYGSGFPKSLDVSKAIDGAAGAEREVIGKYVHPASGKVHADFCTDNDRAVYGGFTGCEDKRELTAPATDAARQWEGYGTALKPSFEPAVLARKPLEGTVAANVTKWGVGGLAIDASRIDGAPRPLRGVAGDVSLGFLGGLRSSKALGETANTQGRWPANVILDEAAGAMLDEQSGELYSHGGTYVRHSREGFASGTTPGFRHTAVSDSGGASRFFYCSKASRGERELGCDALRAKPSKAHFADGTIRRCETHGNAVQSHANVYTCGCAIAYVRSGAEACGRIEGSAGLDSPRAGANRTAARVGNHHPTVKPISLMRYLARLIMPPSPGKILVPFAGSGSEVIGALLEGWPDVTGIEREAEYVAIAKARVALAETNPRAFDVEAVKAAQADARQLDMFERVG